MSAPPELIRLDSSDPLGPESLNGVSGTILNQAGPESLITLKLSRQKIYETSLSQALPLERGKCKTFKKSGQQQFKPLN